MRDFLSKMLRTHEAGTLRADHAGQAVTLAGWVHRRRDHGGLIFVDLRDASGLAQVVFHPEDAPEAFALASELRSEFVLQVEGAVVRRKPGTENPELPTGDIEVAARSATVLNPSETPPFPSTRRPTSTRPPGCATATSTSAASAWPPTSRCATASPRSCARS